MMKNHTAVDMYRYYKERNPGTDVTYTQFKYILSLYNKKVADRLLKGDIVNLGNRVGKLRIKKVARDFNKKTVDWNSTNQLKAQGINKLVFFTDEYWYRWAWEKKSCQIPNKSVYKFRPTGGEGGNRKRLTRLLKSDELAHLNFKE
jgi:hypothetical protein